MVKIAIMNQKGGTGKTTSVLNIAGELTLRGEKVLVVDMDTQGNATDNLKLTQMSEKTLPDAVDDSSVSLSDCCVCSCVFSTSFVDELSPFPPHAAAVIPTTAQSNATNHFFLLMNHSS